MMSEPTGPRAAARARSLGPSGAHRLATDQVGDPCSIGCDRVRPGEPALIMTPTFARAPAISRAAARPSPCGPAAISNG